MKKDTKVKVEKKPKFFSLGEKFGGKINVVGMVVKDVPIGKDSDMSAMLFVTLKNGEDLIEAQMPLDSNADFKKHVLAITAQALKLKK